jgi:hypothetical protein
MKAFEKKDPSILLATLLELIIKFWLFGKKILDISEIFEPFFLMKNPLHWSKSYFLGRNLTKICLEKKFTVTPFMFFQLPIFS